MLPAEVKVGVLALQGAFAKHLDVLKEMGVEGRAVKDVQQLNQCDALIIPGGESSAMEIIGPDLLSAIQTFDGPIFGTCAGAILLAKFGLIDMDILRNGYGRQIASTVTQLSLGESMIEAVFIRAPIITTVHPSVDVLATYQGRPVVVASGNYLAATFHPELTEGRELYDIFFKRLLVTSR